MNRSRLLATLILTLISAFAWAGAQGKWINVHVHEASEQTTVDIRLPLDFIAAAIDVVDTPEFREGKVKLDFRHHHPGEDDAEAEGSVTIRHEHPEVDWVPLLKKMKDLPNGEFVKVDSPEAKVSIKREGGLFLIHVDDLSEEKAQVDVRLPVDLLGAFTVDEENRLDVKAFVTELGKLGTGDLVRVTGGDADVRIWVE